jgi:hypothetical protein
MDKQTQLLEFQLYTLAVEAVALVVVLIQVQVVLAAQAVVLTVVILELLVEMGQ